MMAHPTDDELEAVAQRLELIGPTDVEVVDMLRACKGRVRDEAKDARISALEAERHAANEDVRVLLREIYSRDAYMSPELKAIHNRLAARHPHPQERPKP